MRTWSIHRFALLRSNWIGSLIQLKINRAYSRNFANLQIASCTFTFRFHLYHSAFTTGKSGIKDPIQWLLNSAFLWIDPVRMRTRYVKSGAGHYPPRTLPPCHYPLGYYLLDITPGYYPRH